jgi:hypothetical protein
MRLPVFVAVYKLGMLFIENLMCIVQKIDILPMHVLFTIGPSG